MTESAPIYLDYLATTPVCKEASDSMVRLLHCQYSPEGCWGNPGSHQHVFGRQAKLALEEARQKVAIILNCKSSEVCFESGSTESINHAIRGVLKVSPSTKQHVVLSEIEHPAVMETVIDIAHTNYSLVAPNEYGVIEPSSVAKACIKGQTALVTIMMVNNEIGSINDMAAIVKAVKDIDEDIIVHCDASQAVGKIPVDVKAFGVDLLTVAGHKFYAPKGIGALYVKEGVSIQSLVTGAGHETGRRAGTENVLLAVALGEACQAAMNQCLKNMESIRQLRELLYDNICSGFDLGQVHRNGSPKESERLPGALSISFAGGIRGSDIASQGGLRGVAFSAGAACHSGHVRPSKVLKAIGMDDVSAISTIRLSIGRYTTREVRDSIHTWQLFHELTNTCLNLGGCKSE